MCDNDSVRAKCRCSNNFDNSILLFRNPDPTHTAHSEGRFATGRAVIGHAGAVGAVVTIARVAHFLCLGYLV